MVFLTGKPTGDLTTSPVETAAKEGRQGYCGNHGGRRKPD